MYQKYIISALFVAFVCTNIFAQKNKQEDVLYLKNGSVIRGEIIEQKIGDNLKIQLLGGSVFVFAETELDSIKREAVFTKLKDKSDYFAKTKGYRNMTEGGFIIGHEFSNDWWGGYSSRTDWGVMLHTVNGYQFNRYLYTGIGLGIEKNITYRENFAPIYARVAYDMLKKKTTPYIFTDLGYVLNWTKLENYLEDYKNKGGLYFSTGLGVRVFNSSKVSVTTAISYKRTTINSAYTNWQGDVKQKFTYNRVGVTAGVSF
jgi:hypothetical protein